MPSPPLPPSSSPNKYESQVKHLIFPSHWHSCNISFLFATSRLVELLVISAFLFALNQNLAPKSVNRDFVGTPQSKQECAHFWAAETGILIYFRTKTQRNNARFIGTKKNARGAGAGIQHFGLSFDCGVFSPKMVCGKGRGKVRQQAHQSMAGRSFFFLRKESGSLNFWSMLRGGMCQLTAEEKKFFFLTPGRTGNLATHRLGAGDRPGGERKKKTCHGQFLRVLAWGATLSWRMAKKNALFFALHRKNGLSTPPFF